MISMIQHGESRTLALFLMMVMVLMNRQTERQTKKKKKVRITKKLTRWYLGLQHVHGDNIDQHDPAWRVEHLRFVLDEGNGADALAFKLPAIRVTPLHLATHILKTISIKYLIVNLN